MRITGACFEESINLKHARLVRQLRLKSCRFHNSLRLVNLHLNGWLSFQDSWFGSAINLVRAKIDGQVNLSGSTFSSKLALDGARISGQLSMNGSTFNDALTMNGTEIGQGLFMRDQSTFKDVDMSTAKVGGQVSMIGSRFTGELKMNGTEVGQSLFMQKSTFKVVDLTTARVDGQVELSGSTFESKLTMNALEVGRSLFMSGIENDQGQLVQKATFKDVDLSAAMIGAHLFMYNSRFKSNLSLSGARISGDLDMHCSNFSDEVTINSVAIGNRFITCRAEFSTEQEVVFHFASIGSSFDLSGASVGVIDLTETTIAGEFRLGSAKGDVPTKWQEKSKLVLRNTSVGSIQDAHEESNCWPRELELDGFTYRYLGGLGAEGTADFGKRESSWLVKWLALDPTFTPQPYEQLAKVLREGGYPTKATDVLYAGRTRARRQSAKDCGLLR